MIKLMTIVGARPQFVKAAAISKIIGMVDSINETIVHTGQHYDYNMSGAFFKQLNIPEPTINLNVGSGAHGQQTGLMIQKLEDVMIKLEPSVVLIYGDTNSTLAAAIAASKLQIPIVHVEAGERAFNKSIPEEINRIMADHVSDFLFCSSNIAVNNLYNEGICNGVHLVGDVMYDVLKQHINTYNTDFGLEPKAYYLATIHRASNTLDQDMLYKLICPLGSLQYPTILPLHPRSRNVLGDRINDIPKSIKIIEPAPYADILWLQKNARIVITDSGGIQKEAYWLGVPCITLTDDTEWVELVTKGYNKLVGQDSDKLIQSVYEFEASQFRPKPGLYGDGDSARKIIDIMVEAYG